MNNCVPRHVRWPHAHGEACCQPALQLLTPAFALLLFCFVAVCPLLLLLLLPDVPGAGTSQQQHRHKVRKLGQRSSSADWSQDRLTWQEEISYKKELGYL